MSNNFLDAIKSEAESLQEGGNNRERDIAPTPKNEIIRVNGKINGVKQPTLTLRILPSLSMATGSENPSLGIKQRSILYNLPMPKKTLENTTAILPPEFDIDNEVEAMFQKWTSEDYPLRLHNNFNNQFAKSSASYWLNALLLYRDNTTNEYVPVLNDAGVPKVYAFNIGYSGYKEILNLAGNPDYFVDNNTFISFGPSYPIQISKAEQTKFSVQVIATKPLPAINPNDIGPQLDDFKEIVQPLDVQQPHWWESIKFFMNAAEENLNKSEGQEQQVQQPGLNYNSPFAGQSTDYPQQGQQPSYNQPQQNPTYPAQGQWNNQQAQQPVFSGNNPVQGQQTQQTQQPVFNTGNTPVPDPFSVQKNSQPTPTPTPTPTSSGADISTDISQEGISSGSDVNSWLDGVMNQIK